MKKSWLLFAATVLSNLLSMHIRSMDQEKDQKLASTRLVIIPGKDGGGGKFAASIFPQFRGDQILHAGTPLPFSNLCFPDLCQHGCIRYLEKTMKTLQQDDTVETIILHASSQGTGTAINYVSKHPDKVKMIFCEGMLPSGNSAILWTTQRILAGIARIPASYYWLPYLAKIVFPFYAPAGEQAVLNVDKVKNIPIVVIHCTNDPELSYTDAEAFYAGLRQYDTNKSKYFVPVQSTSGGHVNLVKPGSDHARAFHKILQTHNLPHMSGHGDAAVASIDVKRYQPLPKEHLYDNLIERELRLRMIDSCMKIGGACMAALAGYFMIANRMLSIPLASR